MVGGRGGVLLIFVVVLPNVCVPHRQVLLHESPSPLFSSVPSSCFLVACRRCPVGDRFWLVKVVLVMCSCTHAHAACETGAEKYLFSVVLVA